MSNAAINKIVISLEEQFRIHGSTDIKSGMEAYLRNQFVCFGIKADLRREISRPFIQQLVKLGPDYIEKITRTLWSRKERDFHYTGMEYLSKMSRFWIGQELPLIEYIVQHHSWWDTVDFIATHVAGPYFKKFPEQVKPAIRKWNVQDDFWLHRVSIIFQLGYRDTTDAELLFSQCRRYSREKEFFIRKAIGWALRSYSKTNPELVRIFVANEALSPLSLKEASKYL